MFILKGNLFFCEKKNTAGWISDILKSEFKFKFGPYQSTLNIQLFSHHE